MGLLGWIWMKLAGDELCIQNWMLDGEIRLPKPVKTPSGGRVRCIACVVDIHYRLRKGQGEKARAVVGEDHWFGAPTTLSARSLNTEGG